MLCTVKVRATMVEPWPVISTAFTLSREPPACGVGRFRKEARITTTTTAPMAISTILAGGRFFFAVPYSSPMLIVGPAGKAGGAGGLGGGAGGRAGPGFFLMPLLRLRGMRRDLVAKSVRIAS